MNALKIILLDKVQNFLLNLSIKDQVKISGSINSLRNNEFDCIFIKQLKGEIKELRVKKYRLVFFVYKNEICISAIFVKKTNKTPTKEIEKAEEFYKLFIKN